MDGDFFLQATLFYSLLFETILQTDTAVEHQVAGLGILVVKAEIAHTHKLETGGKDSISQPGFHNSLGHTVHHTACLVLGDEVTAFLPENP